MPLSPAYYDKVLRDAIAQLIDARYVEVRAAKPGAERKPIFASIRALKKVIRRADRMIEAPKAE